MTPDDRPSPDAYDGYPGFSCFKSRAPIRYQRRWLRNLLIQAALDPAIESIGPCSLQAFPTEVEFAFLAALANGTILVLVTELSIPAFDFRHGFDATKTMSRAQIMAEPHLSTGKAIWACKRLTVDPAGQLRALRAVGDAGGTLQLDGVVTQIGAVQNAAQQALALIAQGYLSIDIRCGLVPHAPVKLGPLSQWIEPAPCGS